MQYSLSLNLNQHTLLKKKEIIKKCHQCEQQLVLDDIGISPISSYYRYVCENKHELVLRQHIL